MKKIALIAAAAAFATATTATAGTYGNTAPTTEVEAPVVLPAASSISGPVLGLLLVGAVLAASSSSN